MYGYQRDQSQDKPMAGIKYDAKWWAREGRIALDDGHPDAALYAYSRALAIAESWEQTTAMSAIIAELTGDNAQPG